MPRRDVVGDPGDEVGVQRDRRQVHRRAQHGQLARVHERVLQGHADEVAVQSGRHPRRVGVPVEDVEGRRVLAQQVVVDPVVPDQVIGPQPREHSGQRAAVQVAPAGRVGHRRGRHGGVGQGPGGPGPGVVEHAHAQREPGEAVLPAGRRQVRRHGGQHDAAGAQAQGVHGVGAGDLLDRVQRVEHGLRVGVQAPVGVALVGIAPGDGEDLLAGADEVLDHAALRS